MGKLMLGKPVADRISEKLARKVALLEEKPKLATLRVGNRKNDISYEKSAIRRMESIGILWETHQMPEDVLEEDLIEKIKDLNKDKSVNGILLFNPLPNHFDSKKVGSMIDPLKDIDSLNPVNIGKLVSGNPSGFAPCTPIAAMEILDHYGVDFVGKEVVVVGRSTVVGKPISLLLLDKHATVSICHSKTHNLANFTKKADILIMAIGNAHFADETFIKEEAIVVDVGINIDEDGEIKGDVNLESVIDKVALITPVPRGVGSVTTAVLAKHLLKAYEMQKAGK